MKNLLEQMMKFPMNAMVSGVETVAKTMQGIQHKAESQRTAEDAEGTGEGLPEALNSVSRFVVLPVLEMSKLPMAVFFSMVETIPQTRQEMRELTNLDDGGAGEEIEEFVCETVPLTAQEAALEAEFALAEEIEDTIKDTKWQIGRSGRSDFQGKWTAEFDYRVGTEIDAIKDPKIPHLLSVPGGAKRKGATEKLNVHFTLDRDYSGDELVFIYDRWGAEKDQVSIDGELLTPVGGAGKGKFKHVVLSLKDLSSGDHVVTITTSGETENGKHRIDYLKLAELEKPEENEESAERG